MNKTLGHQNAVNWFRLPSIARDCRQGSRNTLLTPEHFNFASTKYSNNGLPGVVGGVYTGQFLILMDVASFWVSRKIGLGNGFGFYTKRLLMQFHENLADIKIHATTPEKA